MEESNGGNRRRSLSTGFKALYGRVFLYPHLYLLHVVFARDYCRMVVYGYKPDTFIAVYPALQGTDAPRVHIFKNTAVYPADWLAENYRHYLKVRFVL